jgi:hypothetical protein
MIRYPTRTLFAAGLALALLPTPLGAQERNPSRPTPATTEAPAAVVLSNGQRWERISLRHIDARVLAPLFGATVLPTAEPAWMTGAPGLFSGLQAGWPPALVAGILLLQQAGGAFPPGGGGFGAPGGFGPANPAGLPIIADPVTNSLIVDP